MRPDFLTVGELAERTGLTVRALHHYDQVGLLRPAARTPAGYRLYGPDEIRRLQHIAALRRLGLSLEDIMRCLDEGDPPLPEVLDTLLGRLDREIREITAQKERLLRVRNRIDDGEMDTAAWLGTIHETLRAEDPFTPEQLDALAEQIDDMGLGRLGEVQDEWLSVFHELTTAFDGGLSPTHPRVADAARRARLLLAELGGGDPGLDRSEAAMYEAEGARPMTDRGIHMRRDVWAYLGAAMEAQRRSEEPTE